MSLPPDAMMDLMAYADGELDAASRARVEDLLRSSEEARRVVSAMGVLGDVVRDNAAEREPASLRAAEGIADGVMARIASEASGGARASGGASVTSIGAARAWRARAFVAGGVVALAAGVALFVRAKSGPSVIIDDRGAVVASAKAPAGETPPGTASAVASAGATPVASTRAPTRASTSKKRSRPRTRWTSSSRRRRAREQLRASSCGSTIGTEASEMMDRRRFVALSASALALICAAAPAIAQTKPALEILVLYAKKDPGAGHVGPGVPKLPQLSQAPFDRFNTFELLDKRKLGFGTAKSSEPWQGKPSASYQLPTGKALDVALLEQKADGRCEMGAALGKDASDRLRWSAPMNEPFFVAGQSYKDGILVIGITLVP